VREIKFKALNFSYEWCYGNIAVLKEEIGRIDPGTYISNKVGWPFAYHVRPSTVCQFIGLKDKNGVEIYEGDIVEGGSPYFTSRVLGVVRYYGLSFCFEGITRETQYELSGNTDDAYWRYTVTDPLIKQLDEIEVIGNIYQNPELLNPTGGVS
jgi:uncharacterized phage protein (TIGR01671 family)